jgi:hypothetical protein
MAKTVKVYRRKNITHVPYKGAFYAAGPRTRCAVGSRVTVSGGPDGASIIVTPDVAGAGVDDGEIWYVCRDLDNPKKAPKVKASAPVVAHVVTVDEALNVLCEAGYEVKEKTVVKTAYYPSQIERAILSGNWTYDQVKQMQNAISKASDRIAENARYEFRPGDRVEWDSKHGYVKRGVVLSTGKKNAKIKCDDDYLTWRVYLGFLRKASV